MDVESATYISACYVCELLHTSVGKYSLVLASHQGVCNAFSPRSFHRAYQFPIWSTIKIISKKIVAASCLWLYLKTCCLSWDSRASLFSALLYFSIECFCMSIKIDADNSFKQINRGKKVLFILPFESCRSNVFFLVRVWQT
jgi:hypothetical protein